MRTKVRILLMVVVAALLCVGIVSADDGVIFRRNISKTPESESGEAAMSMMEFYVPAQAADGTLLEGIDYYSADDAVTPLYTREYAKPLVAVYNDDVADHDEDMMSILSGLSFGHRDAFAALSLDDGATWKRANLSDSAMRSSFILANGEEYPGDVHYMTFAIAGDRVLAGWLSKYCESGSPAYSLVDDTGEPLYEDLFGVAGAQGSVDYTLQGFPEVGEVPFSCLWTARGQLVQDSETSTYDILWTKAERLTSGRRDANRLEMAGVEGAGFMMVWQEDPEGLRPGQGLGPGEGWSGAIVNQKTDIWYSYIGWDDFDDVADADGNPFDLAEYAGEEMPQVALPMAMPVRVSDNNTCRYTQQTGTDGQLINAYCYEDFDGNDIADLCAEPVSWTNPGGTTLELCRTEDGRVLQGRTGASRPRLTLEPYTDAEGRQSAWVVMAYEELKALGEGGTTDELTEPVDIGKNIWYHTFDMFNPELVAQGMQLNPPAKDHTTDAFFDLLEDDFGNEFYETEIARRFNIMTQTPDEAGDSGVVGVLIYKQGIINQGGPADIFLRRLAIPADFDATVDNPYDYANMACDTWAYADGSNPRYLKGLCLDPGINLSGTNIIKCDNETSGDACAADFPWDGVADGTSFPKMTEWSQTADNLDDESWENPYDVAKGHRGFIDGDFIMMIYAWSPNWKANSVGNDHYNLYVRRSFDGGVTWTTTPAALGGDGTETCEWYGLGGDADESCTTYGAGEFEQARNVSQLVGNKITILDPRYSPTLDSILTDGAYLYPDDERDRSKFFIVYETGDNTTVMEGEAVPLDLFYSRATNWGDDYDTVDYEQDGEIVPGWDWLEHDREDLSGEASIIANSGGTFFYAVWNQWQEDEHENVSDSDVIFRRVMYVDDADAAPTATILYISARVVAFGDEVFFAGAAKDNDHLGHRDGIVEVEWRSNIQGVLSNQRSFSMKAGQGPGKLWRGFHTISFRAKDDEGNWSNEATVYILVGEQITNIYLPSVMH